MYPEVTKAEFIKITKEHIVKVRDNMSIFNKVINVRGLKHDLSKITSDIEYDNYRKVIMTLKKEKTGSQEYNKARESIKPAVDHHYENNEHHPEHFKDGISGMNLIDLIEMMSDWQAVNDEVPGRDLKPWIRKCKDKYNMSDDLFNVFMNTADFLSEYKNKEGTN